MEENRILEARELQSVRLRKLERSTKNLESRVSFLECGFFLLLFSFVALLIFGVSSAKAQAPNVPVNLLVIRSNRPDAPTLRDAVLLYERARSFYDLYGVTLTLRSIRFYRERPRASKTVKGVFKRVLVYKRAILKGGARRGELYHVFVPKPVEGPYRYYYGISTGICTIGGVAVTMSSACNGFEFPSGLDESAAVGFMHELGHAMGARHTMDTTSVMHAAVFFLLGANQGGVKLDDVSHGDILLCLTKG